MDQTFYRILIIDDDTSSIQKIISSLPPHIYKFKIIDTYEEANSVANNWIPHIIILSALLQNIDPFDLIIEFKSNKKLMNTSIILVVDTINQDDYLKAMSLGVFKLLEKPLDETVLKVQINSLISIREVQMKIINEVLTYLKKSLIDDAKEETKKFVTQRIIESYTQLPDTIRQLNKITEETSSSAMETISRLDEIAQIIIDSKKNMDDLSISFPQLKEDERFMALSSNLMKIDDSSFDIINLLQFQDITTQQINYTNSIIFKVQQLLKDLLDYYSEQVLIETQLQMNQAFDPNATIKFSQQRQEDINNIITNFQKLTE